MNAHNQKLIYMSLTLLFVVSFVSCDQISSIREYFSKSKSNKNSSSSLKPPVVQEIKTEMPLPENVLASVGHWTLTKDEFNDRLKALKEAYPDYDIGSLENKKLLLDELVNQELVVMDAESSGLAKEKDITGAVEEFRRTIIVREAARKVTEGINVSEDDERAFYEKNKDSLVEAPQWHVREIVVDSQLRANEILLELLKGSDFAEAAKLNSKSKTAETGGDLGFLTQEPFPEMANALLSLKEGEISSVFKGPDGYYIVKLEEKKGGSQLPFEKVQDRIKELLTSNQQQQAIIAYINELKLKAKVEINENLLK